MLSIFRGITTPVSLQCVCRCALVGGGGCVEDIYGNVGEVQSVGDLFFLKVLFIYLTNRKQADRAAGRGRGRSRDSVAGLGPKTLGS